MDDKQLKQLLAREMAMAQAQGRARQAAPADENFKQFSASELYCPNCKQAMPVREGLLLHVPGGEVYDYKCARCGTSLGTKTTG